MAIIIRQTDSQSLTPVAARGTVQDLSGTGQALAQQGSNIAHVATQLYAQSQMLEYQQEKVAATTKLHELSSVMDNRLNTYSTDTWDTEYLRKGATPKIARDAFSSEINATFADIEKSTDFQAFGSNEQFKQGFAVLKAQTREKYELHAGTTANKSFNEQQKTLADVQLETMNRDAIRDGESGGYPAIASKALEINQYLDSMSGVVFTPADIAKRKVETLQNLTEQWAYNRISESPELFEKSLARGEYKGLAPEKLQKLQGVADAARERSVLKHDKDRIETARRHDEEIKAIQSNLYSVAVGNASDGTPPNPLAALAQLDRPEYRDAMGETYASFRETLIATTKPGNKIGDANIYLSLDKEISRNPSQDTIKRVERQFHVGSITKEEYDHLISRTTSRIDRFVDKAETKRHADTNHAVDLGKGFLQTKGIQDFDGLSQKAQSSFEDVLRETLEKDPTLVPSVEARKLLPHYFATVQDGILSSVDNLKFQYPHLTSQAAVLKALDAKQLDKNEANMLMWALDPANKWTNGSGAPVSVAPKKKAGLVND